MAVSRKENLSQSKKERLDFTGSGLMLVVGGYSAVPQTAANSAVIPALQTYATKNTGDPVPTRSGTPKRLPAIATARRTANAGEVRATPAEARARPSFGESIDKS